MRPEARRSTALLAVLLLSIAAAHAAEPTPMQEIEEQLMCYCGCADLTVRACTCGTAASIREEIAERLAHGETPDQILAVFVGRHGEQILSAPTMEGFNLLAWIMPFASLFAGALLLILVVRRWSAPAAASAAGVEAPARVTDRTSLTERERETLARIEREIREGH